MVKAKQGSQRVSCSAYLTWFFPSDECVVWAFAHEQSLAFSTVLLHALHGSRSFIAYLIFAFSWSLDMGLGFHFSPLEVMRACFFMSSTIVHFFVLQANLVLEAVRQAGTTSNAAPATSTSATPRRRNTHEDTQEEVVYLFPSTFTWPLPRLAREQESLGLTKAHLCWVYVWCLSLSRSLTVVHVCCTCERYALHIVLLNAACTHTLLNLFMSCMAPFSTQAFHMLE